MLAFQFLCSSVISVTLLLPSALAASQIINITFPEKPTATLIPNVVEDHFIGVSYELSPFDSLWGKSVTRQPAAMQNYMANLAARMSKPLRIRLGGNGMDSSRYIPTLTTPLQVIDDTGFNTIRTNFSPKLVDILDGMMQKVGKMQFYLGLSTVYPDGFDDMAQFALYAKEKLGDSLDALLLGNKPDLYNSHGLRPGYGIEDYIPEIETYLDKLKDVGAIGDEPMAAGPTTCCGWDVIDVLDAGLDKLPYKYYTTQQYPHNICQGPNVQNTNITHFITHANVEPYLTGQKVAMKRMEELGVPLILSEFNSVSCGGSNISDTFAMSLWVADVGLKAASLNYSAVFIHTREQNIAYNLFDPPSPERSLEPDWRTGSPYYGALFLSEVTSDGGNVVIDLNLNNSNTNQLSTIAGYAIYDDAGATRGKLALFNFGSSEEEAFNLPPGLAHTITVRMLLAPNIYERTEISWAGQTVRENGILMGDQANIEMNCEKGCRVHVPGPSAALVALDEASTRLFTGDSTVQALRGDQGEESAGMRRVASAMAQLVLGMLGAFVWGLISFGGW
ncbi:hypothetical protein CPC08DRAFT_70930 [Agrocybe pediades]|nr:hypothetical protein CPC08DRAFT_70930 [Agrocybe pediades]